MARGNWKAHCQGGRLVVAIDIEVWIASASPESADSFEPLSRELLPPAPIHCAATDGTHLVLAGGPPSRPRDD